MIPNNAVLMSYSCLPSMDYLFTFHCQLSPILAQAQVHRHISATLGKLLSLALSLIIV